MQDIGYVSVKKDAWDSSFFSRKIGRAVFNKPIRSEGALRKALSEMRSKGKRGKYELVVFSSKPSKVFREDLLREFGAVIADRGIDFVMRHPYPKIKREEESYVCPASAGDIRSVRSIASTAFPLSRLYKLPFATSRSVGRYHSIWIENIFKDKDKKIFVLKRRGKVLAFAAFGIDHHPSCLRIILIAVRSGFRGKGYGKEILSSLISWAAGEGIRSVYVKTQMGNERACSFYRNMGFTGCEEQLQYYMAFTHP